VDSALYIVGLGVKIPDHVTVAAFEALARCERIYTIVQHPPARWMPAGAHANCEVINLMSRYVEGAVRHENYERVVREILKGLNETRPIAYVTYGNPLSYDSVAQALVQRAPRFDCRVEVVPGISSIDTILCDLGVDMAPGVQVYEASWLVATRTPLNVSVAAILLQLGHFGTARAHYRERRGVETLTGLVAYLSQFYPVSHNVHLVQSGDGFAGTLIRQIQIAELNAVGDKDRAESVYIPALMGLATDPLRRWTGACT
jgi:precorrin-2 methylase